MARIKSSGPDDLTLQMALIGYELERQKIDAKIKEIHAQLGGRKVALPSAAASAAAPAEPRKRNLSVAARKRIAMAQKRRWAEHRKRAAIAKAQAAKPARPAKPVKPAKRAKPAKPAVVKVEPEAKS